MTGGPGLRWCWGNRPDISALLVLDRGSQEEPWTALSAASAGLTKVEPGSKSVERP